MEVVSQYYFLKEFGKNLRREFEDSGEMLEELAEDSDVSMATLSRCMSGIQMPSLKAFINIMCALGLEPEDLVDFDRRIRK